VLERARVVALERSDAASVVAASVSMTEATDFILVVYVFFSMVV